MSALTRHNIETSLNTTFKIEPKSRTDTPHVRESGLELGGICHVSQNDAELTQIVQQLGFMGEAYNFVQNARWSCANLDKIKILWKEQVSQCIMHNNVYHIISGRLVRKHGRDMFRADTLHPDITVDFISDGLTNTNKLLVPQEEYHITTDISDTVPNIKFMGAALQCVEPKNLLHISINRQGVYINRKFRTNKVVVDTPKDACVVSFPYTLKITYKGEQLLEEPMING